jgi:hypothetical protein
VPPLTIAKRSQLIAEASALTALGLLLLPTPARAGPLLPLPSAPACSQWAFPGNFVLKQSNGDTVRFEATGIDVDGFRSVTATGGINGPLQGNYVRGGINGNRVDFEIDWDSLGPDGAIGHYTGAVDNDGYAHGTTYDALSHGPSARWDSQVPLVCATPAAPPAGPAAPPAPAPQPAPDAQTAVARLGVSVNGPKTLPAGQSGTYTVNIGNAGEASAPVELFISFNTPLQQTNQVMPSDGVNCEVQNSSAVRCSIPQFQSKAQASITVQGRGSTPGAGQLVVNINSSDPGAQFVQKSQQLAVAIT